MAETIKNAVQPDAWYTALPRPQYATLKQVPTADPWFSVYEIQPNIYAIYEPRHFQEVISFLVIGSQRAMMVDTGLGMGDIKKVVDALYDGEIFVVNTHTHFDHIGGNHQFPVAYVLDHPVAIGRLQNGLPHSMVEEHLVGDSTVLPYPDGFEPDTYRIEPCNFRTVQSGHVFDLGDRQFQVLSTPGHSPDSIMLFDEKNKVLFTGDTYYPATMYAHLSSPDGLFSVFETYRATMRQVADRFHDYTVIPSHNEPLRTGAVLVAVADAFDEIAKGSLTPEIDASGLKKYTFNDFCIVTK